MIQAVNTSKTMSDNLVKIKMQNPIVEMDGDEMARVVWAQIKEALIMPFVDMNTEYFDLSVTERDRTNNEVSVLAGEAVRKHFVGVKCPTISPTPERIEEYKLSGNAKSPNGVIRNMLGGVLFRKPICAPSIRPIVSTWQEPITIVRHIYGDVYRNIELTAEKGDICEIALIRPGSETFTKTIYDFPDSGGIVQAVHNTDESIIAFARCCMAFAIDEGQDLWFGAKDTVSKIYDRRFFDIFDQIFKDEYKSRFEAEGIIYRKMLIDDAAAQALRSKGGFVWACKNYDGDVMSDIVAAGFGSSAMMTSFLVSPDGQYLYETAHGTVRHHYYKHLKGERVSTNPAGMIFAWSNALCKRGEIDGSKELVTFADVLAEAVIKTIEDGILTDDLYHRSDRTEKAAVDTQVFISETAGRVHELLEPGT